MGAGSGIPVREKVEGPYPNANPFTLPGPPQSFYLFIHANVLPEHPEHGRTVRCAFEKPWRRKLVYVGEGGLPYLRLVCVCVCVCV